MKQHGYYLLAKPELGVFGPYQPIEVHRLAVEAGHVAEDIEREQEEITRRLNRFQLEARAKIIRSIQAAAATMSSTKMRQAADALDAIDDTLASAVEAERNRLGLALPVFIEEGIISIFRWDRRDKVLEMLETQTAQASEAE